MGKVNELSSGERTTTTGAISLLMGRRDFLNLVKIGRGVIPEGGIRMLEFVEQHPGGEVLLFVEGKRSTFGLTSWLIDGFGGNRESEVCLGFGHLRMTTISHRLPVTALGQRFQKFWVSEAVLQPALGVVE